MVGEWRSSTWGEEVSLEYGKSLRGYQVSHGDYRVFGSNGPIGWTEQPLAPGPGVILGRKGAYRGVQYSSDPFYVIDTAYYVVPIKDIDMRWIYYAILHYKLGEIDDGSPIPSTTRSAVYMQDLEVPPVSEQRAIAHILGTLDDKIELNRRMNQTLEEMARALFKSWFVDFDPVRAKMEGRWKQGESLPGMPADLWELFPDKLVDSELGEIPEGWRADSFRSVCTTLVDGDWVESKDQGGSDYRLLQISNIGVGDFIETGKYRFISEETFHRLNCTRIREKDILIARMPSPTGRAWLAHEMPWQMITAVDVAIAQIDPRLATPDYVVHYLNSPQHLSLVSNYETGSTRARISRRDLAGLHVLVPSIQAQIAFTSVASAMRRRSVSSATHNQTLAQTRDTLLPKLISGELRVEDADRFIKDQEYPWTK